MKSRALWFGILFLLAAGNALAAAPPESPQVTWTGDFFSIHFQTAQGVLRIQGRHTGRGLEAAAAFDGVEAGRLALCEGSLALQWEEGGAIDLNVLPEAPGLAFQQLRTGGREGIPSALERALAALSFTSAEWPGPARDRTLVSGLSSVFLMAPELARRGPALDPAGRSLAECMRQRRECRKECEFDFCDRSGCNVIGLSLCYDLCDLEYIGCSLRAILTGYGWAYPIP